MSNQNDMSHQNQADDGGYRIRIRSTKDMPAKLRQALAYAYEESFPEVEDTTDEFIVSVDDMTSSSPSRPSDSHQPMSSMERSMFRSLVGMICLLLGVIGTVTQIFLVGRGVLPNQSWLWAVSLVLGMAGIASFLYDCLRMYKEQTQKRP